MLDILLTLALAVSPDPPAYDTDALHAFVAVANDRVVDGVSYADGDGVLSAGLIHAGSSGFFASTELAAFHGGGDGMPAETIFSLGSSAGWRAALHDHRFALEILDYRFDSDTGGTLAHQGLGVSYRFGRLQVEYAEERDKSYFYRPARTFFEYDVRRALLAWQQPAGENVRWSLGAGMQRIDRIDVRYRFISAGLQWHWRSLDWQVSAIHSFDDRERLIGDIDRTRVVLRVALPFRVF